MDNNLEKYFYYK